MGPLGVPLLTPAFEPTAIVALDFVGQRYRVGSGSLYTQTFGNLPNLSRTGGALDQSGLNIDGSTVISISGLTLPQEYTVVSRLLAPPTDTLGDPEIWTLFLNASNYVANYILSSTDRNTLDVRTGGATVAGFPAGSALSSGALAGSACRIRADNFALSTNGSAVATDTSGTLPAPTILQLGHFNGGSQLSSHLRSLIIYPRAFTDEELRAASMV